MKKLLFFYFSIFGLITQISHAAVPNNIFSVYTKHHSNKKIESQLYPFITDITSTTMTVCGSLLQTEFDVSSHGSTQIKQEDFFKRNTLFFATISACRQFVTNYRIVDLSDSEFEEQVNFIIHIFSNITEKDLIRLPIKNFEQFCITKILQINDRTEEFSDKNRYH